MTSMGSATSHSGVGLRPSGVGMSWEVEASPGSDQDEVDSGSLLECMASRGTATF
jgi:hypothetical protein